MTDDLNIYDFLVAQEKLRQAEFAYIQSMFNRLMAGTSTSDEVFNNLKQARMVVQGMMND